MVTEIAKLKHCSICVVSYVGDLLCLVFVVLRVCVFLFFGVLFSVNSPILCVLICQPKRSIVPLSVIKPNPL